MIRAIVVLLLMVGIAAAQQQADPANLQRYLVEMQRQRDDNANALVVARAQAAQLTEEVARLKTRVQELEKSAKPADSGDLPK